MKKSEELTKEFSCVKDILYNSKEKYPENVAFVTKIKNEDKSITYENHTYTDLLDDINAFGTALFKLGFKDKRIAVIGRNRYEWVVGHLSNLLGGIVSIPIDKELQYDEFESSLVRSKADAIIFDEKYEENINKILKQKNTNIKEAICMSKIPEYKDMQGLIEMGRNYIKEGYDEFIKYEVDPKKMGILLFTSGTTSKSKAVMLSQYGIAKNVEDMLLVEKLYPTDTNIAFLPFHHIFGSTCIVVMIASGVRTVFTDGLRYIKQNLKEYGVSVFVGVPILIDKMYSGIEKEIEKQGKTKLIKFATKVSNLLLKLHIDIRRKLFKSVIDGLGGKMRFVISGGAPLDKQTAIKFNEFGIRLVQGYGLTETSPVIASENSFFIRSGSVGFPMKNVKVEVVNKDENGIGEIRVKGPNVMLGYYEDEERTKEVLKDGWFYTGDLGYLDKDGCLFLTGREKDVIVLKNGKKVFPDEIEMIVNRLEEVEECIVYGAQNKEDLNDYKVAIKIVYNENVVKDMYNDISEEELHKILWEKIKEINKTFPSYKYIKSMILTKKPLIKTTTNKVKRKEEIALLNKNA